MFQLRGRVIFFGTGNVNKFNEARKVLGEYKIAVGMLRVKTVEIQSDSLEEIAKTSVLEAFEKCNLPLIVEDAGLFVEALGGFPGPYAAYVYKTIGNEGLLKLMQNVGSRNAEFRSVIAYYSKELDEPLCFEGQVAGEIIEKAVTGRDSHGFGFDPVFKPAASRKVFAEMDVVEKNGYSHRANALRKFAEWYARKKAK